MSHQPLPSDYAERVYAGVLGKSTGVYLGRPFEGWSHEAIVERFGSIRHYVHDELGVPLVVADDDLSGTFTFLRSLEDAGFTADLSPNDVAESWLNYLIEGRTVLWWGGVGLSTEHTAYLRLKRGVLPPASGSIESNGKIVAEQIGAQIFIDGWGLLMPGDPEGAANLAGRAAVVSHDGEAVIAARVVAAMVAAAFIATDVDAVLDAGLRQAPPSSIVARLGREIRAAQVAGVDWNEGFRRIKAEYGYDRYGGNCHVIPNHALILLALAHGRGDFDRSLEIVNTCGWDTDCNSGNVGCVLGVLNGLGAIDARWRGFADRLLLPTADGGRCVTDCAREAEAIVRMAQSMRVEARSSAKAKRASGRGSGVRAAKASSTPERSPRFNFKFPGSLQGFGSADAVLTNDGGRLRAVASGPAIVTTPTFLQPEELESKGYGLAASPTLYPGQQVRARVAALGGPVRASLLIRVYGTEDGLHDRTGPVVHIDPGPTREIEWRVPDLEGRPVAAVGFRIEGAGILEVESLEWQGEPETSLSSTAGGLTWRHAWVDGLSGFYPVGDALRAIQNEGTGLALHGTQEWRDVAFSAGITPYLAMSFGLAVRAQGMRRYVAALVEDGRLRLVRVADGRREILAEATCDWPVGTARELKVAAKDDRFFARCGEISLQAKDSRLAYGGVALVLTEGRIEVEGPRVRPT